MTQEVAKTIIDLADNLATNYVLDLKARKGARNTTIVSLPTFISDGRLTLDEYKDVSGHIDNLLRNTH